MSAAPPTAPTEEPLSGIPPPAGAPPTFGEELMGCDDLSATEHRLLRELTTQCHKRTGIVAAPQPGPSLQGLIELGLVERSLDNRLRVLIPCRCREASADALSSGISCEDLRSPSAESIPAAAGGTEKAISTTSKELSSSSAAAEFSNVKHGRRLPVRKRTKSPSVAPLLKRFSDSSRTYHYTAGLAKADYPKLGKQLKQWMSDGAEVEEIADMIDQFFLGLPPGRKSRYLWKKFIAQRAQLFNEVERKRQTHQSREKRDDAYWLGNSAATIQARNARSVAEYDARHSDDEDAE